MMTLGDGKKGSIPGRRPSYELSTPQGVFAMLVEGATRVSKTRTAGQNSLHRDRLHIR